MENQWKFYKNIVALHGAGDNLKQIDEHESMRTTVGFIISERAKTFDVSSKIISNLMRYILPPLKYEEDFAQADYDERIERLRNFAKAILGIPKEENNACTTITKEMSKSFANAVQYILPCIDNYRPKTKDETYYDDTGENSLYFFSPKTSQDIHLGLNYWPALHKLIGPSPCPTRLYIYQLNQAIRMVNIMFELNRHWGALFGVVTKQQIVPETAFQTFKFFKDYEEFCILPWNWKFEKNQPFLFPANFRQEIFRNAKRKAYYGVLSSSPFYPVTIKASRNNMFDVVGKILSESDMYSYWLFKFENEKGEGLGPTREFYTKFSQEIGRHDLNLWIGDPQISSDEIKYVDSPCGLFPSPCLQLDYNSRNILTATGKLMAKALLDNNLMDLNFSNALYKCIIGGVNNVQRLNLSDLKDVMPSLVKFVDDLVEVMNEASRIKNDTSLTSEQREESISNLKCDGCSFEDLCINFTLPGFPDIEMVDGGADELLSADNVEEYLKLLVWWFMYKGPQEKLECIKAGYKSMLDEELFDVIVPEDLENLLCGAREKPWTVIELTQNCTLSEDLKLDSPVVKHLFKVLSSFSREDQKMFLKFVTGTPNLPIGGFASLKPKLGISLKSCAGKPNSYLPTASTCSHLLMLPKYTKEEVLRKKLLKAINEGQNLMDIA